jgi:hypothetical protein
VSNPQTFTFEGNMAVKTRYQVGGGGLMKGQRKKLSGQKLSAKEGIVTAFGSFYNLFFCFENKKFGTLEFTTMRQFYNQKRFSGKR